MKIIEKITEKAKEFFSNSKGSHDWEHTLRVHKLCLYIGKKEGADIDILEPSAMLHDIGRGEQDSCGGKTCHAERGSEMARELLYELGMDKDRIEKITDCIETHRFRKGRTPDSKEARVLFDADKLDSIGAVGIGRAFLFAGEIGARLHNKDVDIEKTDQYTKEDTAYREYMVKLRKVKERMMTEEGKRLAEERHDFMVEFFKRLNKEVEGEL